MSVYDCRQIQSYPTTIQPMRGLVDRIKAMEGKDGILSVSIAHCFPYGDVREIGTRVLVIADGDKKKADALATTLGEELVSLRGKTQPPSFDVAGRRRRGRRLQRPAGGDRRSRRQCRRRRAVGQHRHPAPSDREARSRMPASARSGIRSPCASASMPAWARRSACASAARLRPARASRSTPRSRSSASKRDAWQSFGPTQVSGGRLRRRAYRRRGGRADCESHASDGPRTLHQPRHRSAQSARSWW